MSDWINDLERLKALLDSGSISKSEFEASKARVLGSGERQPELAVADPVVVEPELEQSSQATIEPEAEWSHSSGEQRPPLIKRIVLGTAIIVPIVLLSTWAMGRLASAFMGEAVPSDMTHQCVGLGAGDTVMRPYNVSLEQLVAFIKSNKFDALSPGKTKDVAWKQESDDSYTLTITTKDTLAGSQSVTKISFRLVEGKGPLKNCGPNTLSFQRQVVDGRDADEQGAANFIAVLLMASGFSEAASESPVAPKDTAFNTEGAMNGTEPQTASMEEVIKTQETSGNVPLNGFSGVSFPDTVETRRAAAEFNRMSHSGMTDPEGGFSICPDRATSKAILDDARKATPMLLTETVASLSRKKCHDGRTILHTIGAWDMVIETVNQAEGGWFAVTAIENGKPVEVLQRWFRDD